MISLNALGSVDVREASRGSLASLLSQPRRVALLVYIAVEGGDGFVSRDQLLAMFWPESDDSRARASLRQALAFLRRVLGAESLRTVGDDGVGVDLAVVSTDVLGFRQAIADRRMADAMALYRGAFLQGFLVDEAPTFDQWASGVREVLARDAVQASDALSAEALERRDWTSAISWARRAQEIAPLNEQVHRRLLAALSASGERAEALLEHERFASRLMGELEVTPSAETLALVAELRGVRTAAAEVRGDRVEATTAMTATTATTATTAATAATPSESPNRARRAMWHLPSAALLLAVVAAGVYFLTRDRTPESFAQQLTATSSSRIAVMPLDNQTRDSSLGPVGRMAADWITEGIARVDGMQVVPVTVMLASEQALRDTLANSLRDAWQSVANDVGASMVVRGTVYRDRETLHFQASVVDVQSGSIVRAVEMVSVPVDSLMVGIDRLRTRVLAAIAPLADSTTHLRRAIAPPTYEAYRSYVSGLETFVGGDAAGALRHFERSASADSSYPMPRIASAIMLLNLGDANGAAALLTQLQRERDQLGPLEASTLDMTTSLIRGDLGGAYDAALRQARVAPGTIGEYMVAEAARKMNRPREAVSVLRALGPDRGELRGWRPYWRELTYSLHMLGEHAEELVAAQEALQRYPTEAPILTFVVRAHAARGDTAAIASVLRTAEATPLAVNDLASLRVTAATELAAHEASVAPAYAQALISWIDALPAATRESGPMRRMHAQALLLSNGADRAVDVMRPLVRSDAAAPLFTDLGLAGVSAAAAGDSAGARSMLQRIQSRADALNANERGILWGLPTYWQSAIAAQLADSALALSLLREARAQGLGVEPSIHAQSAFARLKHWPPFAALLVPAAVERAAGTAKPISR